MQLHYSKEDFWDSTHKEICDMWKEHIRFNKWEIRSDNEQNKLTDDVNYKKVNIEEISFL